MRLTGFSHKTAMGTLLMALLITASGCAATLPPRRPAPAPQQAPPATQQGSLHTGPHGPEPARYPSPRAGSAYDSPSEGVGVLASAVPGAGAVSAVVLGNVALLGIPNTDVRVHHKVADQIQTAFPHIAEVRVATDNATISRLQLINEGIRTQNSIASFLPELATMSNRMTPIQ